jgi:ADP-heptose:LPS heptosyltransferase
LISQKKSTGCTLSNAAILKLQGRGNRRMRALDRYLGIPIVFFAGYCRRKGAIPIRPRRLGLLNTAAVGDTILMSGPLADLRAAYPDAQIVYFAGPSNYEAACLLEGTDVVVKLPVFSPLRAIREVRTHNIDLLLDFGPWSRLNAIIAIFSGADFIAGFRTGDQGRHFGYDLVVNHSEDAHELENHRGLIRALGIRPSHPPLLKCPASENPKVYDFSRRFVVFHLWPGGSAARHKLWPLGRWVALAEDLAIDRYDVVFTAAADQRELNDSVINAVNPSLRSRMRNAAGLSLRETLRLLARADLVVSVDTGVMHMAAALGACLVALHGPSSPRRWGPISEKAIVVEAPMKGCGFLNLGFEKARGAPPCMNAISYRTVKGVCDALLGKLNSSRGDPLQAPLYDSSSGNPSAVAPSELDQRSGVRR